MKNAVFITKIYNHMDSLNAPLGYIAWLFNGCNLILGFVSPSEINTISAILGIFINFAWHLYKLFRRIQLDQEQLPEDKYNVNNAPFERRCLQCSENFEPEHADQIFCNGDCKLTYMTDLSRRKTVTTKKDE
jgi:Zn finger protein HypA/HybF involved in hydrogenase expression